MRASLVSLMLALGASAAYSQRRVPDAATNPDAWELVQDTLYVLRWYPNDTIPRGMICASYEFTMRYDSLCEVQYDLTEWKRNGVPLRMPKWRDGRMVNAPAAYLNANNQTDTFTCKAGDTLSFFRWLHWHSLKPGQHDVDGYAALDTLAFAVELVRHDDSTRAALIDSIGALPRADPGRPYIFGSRPIMAMVAYAVPPELEGKRVFMRLLLYHRGSGPYWFIRRDATTSYLSRFMSAPWYQGYVMYYSPQGLPKLARDRAGASNIGARLQVVGDGPGARSVRIRFQGAPPGISTSILVTDVSGQNVFYPMMWAPGIEGETELPYRFTQSGAYLIALIYQDRIQEVVRWNVTN